MTDQLDQKLRTRLQVSLFVVFLTIFAATSVLTLLALFGNFGALTPEQKDLLVKATLLEVAAGVIALFYAIFGLRSKSQTAAETPSEPRTIAPARIDATAQSLNSAQTRHAFAQILMNIADSSAQPTIQSLVPENAELETQAMSIRKVQALALAILFRDMGLIVIDAKGQIQLVSDLAGCFIRSIAIHLEENLDFIGGWTEHGRDNPKAQTPRKILRAIEERRVGELGAEIARPIRSAKSALVMIKAGRVYGEDVFLMQLSDSWGGPYFWFIGGLMEQNDKTPNDCALRELNEELALAKGDVLSLNLICSVPDRRISERLGAFTDYSYEIYQAVLVSESNRVQALRSQTSELETYHGIAKFKRVNRWQTWNEIETDIYMQQHAAPLLSALRAKAANLPYSVSWKVPKSDLPH